MNEITTTEKTIATLDPQAAFKLIEFYENAANIVKGGAWTITTWILTINAALLAYSFQLYTEHSDLHGFIWIQGAICCVGFALCVFLCFLILDQGNHLRGYWTAANKIGAWNAGVQDLVLKEGDVQTVREPIIGPTSLDSANALLH